jgi:1-phosphofructokinase
MGSKIVTLTLNPSLDRTLVTHYLSIGYHNRTSDTTRLDPAGRGVNISRALRRLSCDTTAVIMRGNDATGEAYQALITDEGFPVEFVLKEGRTRSNITIVDTGNKTETHIIEEGEGCTDANIQAICDTLAKVIQPDDLLVLAGSLPGDSPADTYARLFQTAHAAGAVVVLAGRNTDRITQALESGPDVVVLTRNEMEALFNYPIRTPEDILFCSQKLRDSGVRQVITTTLQDNTPLAGVLVTTEGAWGVNIVEGENGTQDGVEDALLAGFLTAWTKRYPSDSALALGGAAAMFTAGQRGSEFPTLADAQANLKQVEVTEVAATPQA